MDLPCRQLGVGRPDVGFDQTSGVEFLGDTVRFTGTAADDLGVLEVRYSIRDKDTDLWLSYGTSWRASRMHHNAVLADPHTATTEWTIERELPPGRYGLIVEVRDQVLHLGELPDWISFTVEE